MAGEPDRLRVGARGRERELPGGQPVALGEQLGRLDAPPRPAAGTAARGRRARRSPSSTAGGAKPQRRAQVGLVEVDVGVAVDVGEAAAVAVGDVQRPVVVQPGHPRHRDAVGQVPPRARGQLGGAPGAALERRLLARPDRGEAARADPRLASDVCQQRVCRDAPVATGARSMVVRPCPRRSSPTRWSRPRCPAWGLSRRSRSRGRPSPARRCARCSASPASVPASRRRSRRRSPGATCSS